jgi:transcriptional regulator with XRE-family HTH domain
MGSKKFNPKKPRPLPPSLRRTLTAIAGDLRAWRKLRGLTQVQLSERAGVAVNTVRRIEDGDGGISLENLLRVLRALGVLDSFSRSLDPYETDVGRLRSEETLPQRVRPRSLSDA